MPAIAEKVKAENDAFYWHLGDLRANELDDKNVRKSMLDRLGIHPRMLDR